MNGTELDYDDLDDPPFVDRLQGFRAPVKEVLTKVQAGEISISVAIYVHGDLIANLSVYRLFAMVPGVGESAAFRIGQSMQIRATTRIKDLTDDQKQEAYVLIRSHIGDR